MMKFKTLIAEILHLGGFRLTSWGMFAYESGGFPLHLGGGKLLTPKIGC